MILSYVLKLKTQTKDNKVFNDYDNLKINVEHSFQVSLKLSSEIWKKI